MKKIILILLLLSSGFVFSQNLQNTLWKTYNATLFDTIYIEIGVDSVKQYLGKDSLLVISIYSESNDTVKIIDVGGSLACPITDTGTYRFTIINDTLSLYVIFDNCFVRNFSYDGVKAWRAYDYTAITERERKFTTFSIYPNPSSGFVFLDLPSNGTLEVYNQKGQIVERMFLQKDMKNLNLSLEKGLYFMRFHGLQNIQGTKMVVE